MRVIKFRIWDTGLGRMFHPNGDTLKEIVEAAMGCTGDEWWVDDDDVIMQFTGLKDKNGKEICEGDIIRNNGQNNQLAIVDPGVAKIKVSYGHGDCGYDAALSYFSYYGDGEDIEVIGNIYENPELTKAKQSAQEGEQG